MQTAGEMMNLRESVDLRESKLGSEKACGGGGGMKRKGKQHRAIETSTTSSD